MLIQSFYYKLKLLGNELRVFNYPIVHWKLEWAASSGERGHLGSWAAGGLAAPLCDGHVSPHSRPPSPA